MYKDVRKCRQIYLPIRMSACLNKTAIMPLWLHLPSVVFLCFKLKSFSNRAPRRRTFSCIFGSSVPLSCQRATFFLWNRRRQKKKKRKERRHEQKEERKRESFTYHNSPNSTIYLVHIDNLRLPSDQTSGFPRNSQTWIHPVHLPLS